MNRNLLIAASFVLGMTMSATGAFAAGDAAAGKEVFKECMACHTVEAGKNRVGPSLHGVVGRKAGSADGFKYSKPMQERNAADFTWTPENVAAFVKSPKTVVPGTAMSYAGLANAAKYKADPDTAAANLIAYLSEQK